MSGEAPAAAGGQEPNQQPSSSAPAPVHHAKRSFDIGEFVLSLSKFIPSVQKPLYKQSFNTKMMWVGMALISYLILSNITVVGLSTQSFEQFKYLEIVLGARFGSLMTLGIGPIVTAGIILQLLVGSLF